MAAALKQLVGQRSLLIRGLIAYLRALEAWPEKERPPHLKGRKLAELYLEPDVLKQEPRNEEDTRRLSADSLAEEQVARFADKEQDRRTRVPWNRELRRIHSAAIIGLPGAGKTLLTHMTALELAQQSLQDIESQSKSISDIAIPVSVRLADIAEKDLAITVQDRVQFVLAGIGLGEQEKTAFDRVVGYILERVGSPQVWLFLDALDEVLEPGQLKAKLNLLTNAARCKIIVTSRPYGYDTGYLPFILDSEYELAPFTPRQRREFIDNWFKNDESKKSHVRELAQANPQFGDLTRNPLLLTLTCATAENHELLPQQTRRVDLYRYIVRDMARGAWKEDAKINDQQISLLVRLLQAVSWELFHRNPRRTAFDDNEWIDALLKASENLPVSWPLNEVFLQLKLGGFVVSPAIGQSMFVHRSFLEFLAAEHVAHQEGPLDLIKPFLWQKGKDGIVRWQPAAAEMICFLGGSLHNPESLLAYLLMEDLKRPDHFGTMVQLAGRALADIRPSYDSGEIAQVTVDSLMELRYRLCPDLRGQLIPALKSPLATAALIQRFHDHYSDSLNSALGCIGNQAAISALIQRLWDAEYSDEVASSFDPLGSFLGKSREHWEDYKHTMWARVAQTLERTDGEPDLSSLIRLVKEHPSAVVRNCAARKLASTGDQEAVSRLIEQLQQHPASGVRQSIASIIGEIECEAAIPALIRAMREDPDSGVREAATKALGFVGRKAAIPALLEQVGIAPESRLWEEAIVAAARLGKDPTASELFADLMTRNTNLKNNRAVAKALCYIGDPVPTSDLVALMCDPDPDVRGAAALALGRTRDKVHAGILIEKAQDDPDSNVRRRVMGALGLLRQESVIPVLVEHLHNDSDADVRFAAAEALATMGYMEVVPFFLELIFSGRYADVGGRSISALVQVVGQAEATELVRAKAQMSQGHDRRVLVWALRGIGGSAAVDALIELIRYNPDSRREAVKSLGEMRGEAAVPILMETALRDASLSTRRQAITALGLISSVVAVPVLIKLLQDGPDLSTLDRPSGLRDVALARQLAADALGRICAEASAPALMGAVCKDHDQKVRWAAEKALARIYHTGSRWFPVLDRA